MRSYTHHIITVHRFKTANHRRDIWFLQQKPDVTLDHTTSTSLIQISTFLTIAKSRLLTTLIKMSLNVATEGIAWKSSKLSQPWCMYDEKFDLENQVKVKFILDLQNQVKVKIVMAKAHVEIMLMRTVAALFVFVSEMQIKNYFNISMDKYCNY